MKRLKASVAGRCIAILLSLLLFAPLLVPSPAAAPGGEDVPSVSAQAAAEEPCRGAEVPCEQGQHHPALAAATDEVVIDAASASPTGSAPGSAHGPAAPDSRPPVRASA